VRFALAIGLVASLGFFAGRQWPVSREAEVSRTEAEVASPAKPGIPASETSQAIRDAPVPSRPVRRDRHRPELSASAPELLGKQLAPVWVDLARRDPEGARAVSAVVVRILERRRGGRDGGRECFPPEFADTVWLRFEADVQVRGSTISIGPGRFVEVADGVPLRTKTTDCIARLLAGEDEIQLPDSRLPNGYSGPVEYRVGYRFRDAAARLDTGE